MKSESILNTLKSLIIYYYHALQLEGCSDPKQMIATQLVEMINLTEEQKDFVIEKTNGLDLLKALDNILILIGKLEKGQKYDQQIINVIKQSLEIIKTKIKEG